MKSIFIPPAAFEDDAAVEMARLWVARQGLHGVLKVRRPTANRHWPGFTRMTREPGQPTSNGTGEFGAPAQQLT